jgi:Uma2 family endonuclease
MGMAELRAVQRHVGVDAQLLKIEQRGKTLFYHPDLMVTCSARNPSSHSITEPSLIVEVRSPSTERMDRTEEFFTYTQLPMLEAYLLMAQDEAWIEVMLRQDAWSPRIIESGERLTLPWIGVTFELDAVYA